ncbi:hypothetical protein DSM02_733 [Leeuwenhoekiella polynyae]|uniref:Uncharacterized protein n=1 Tax=Leeuwenhoekiella polynyae TaxID=1550906 RepID=A0A4Q0PF73_9FLAO|nr:hypothetical protein DSM02_733 [Leeuwenhoekiella polynyae]
MLVNAYKHLQNVFNTTSCVINRLANISENKKTQNIVWARVSL